MSRDTFAARDRVALDESLAAWLGWFEVDPVPTEFALLVEQLEASYDRSETQPESPDLVG